MPFARILVLIMSHLVILTITLTLIGVTLTLLMMSVAQGGSKRGIDGWDQALLRLLTLTLTLTPTVTIVRLVVST